MGAVEQSKLHSLLNFVGALCFRSFALTPPRKVRISASLRIAIKAIIPLSFALPSEWLEKVFGADEKAMSIPFN
jgi:hypothetical protein